MAENSKIEWCHHTFNHVRGCTKVSPGCKNCYAETMSGRNPKTLGVWGPNGTRVVAAESYWREPLKWDRLAKLAGERRRVFCASLADVFEDWTGSLKLPSKQFYDTDACICDHCGAWMTYTSQECTPGCQAERVPRKLTLTDVRRRLFGLIDETPNLDWLLLTKRPENVLAMTHDAWCKPAPGHVSQNEGDGRHWHWPPNVWLGVSVEDQQRADERIPHLLRTPAAVRFLSVEPLLSAINLSEIDTGGLVYRPLGGMPHNTLGKVDWVIVGGESGHNARPLNVGWVRSIVRQCRAASVPVFVKQLGRSPMIETAPDGYMAQDQRGLLPLRLADRKGGTIEEWPDHLADLRVREFPAAAN